MDDTANDFTFRGAFQHFDLEYIDLWKLLKQTGNRGVDIFETLLCEQLSLAPFRQIAIPWMNVSRKPFNANTHRNTVERQHVVANTAARFESESLLGPTYDPVRLST